MSHVINFGGRTALVCGAGAGGIGLATTLQLADAGADIVAVDLRDELVAETLELVRARGRKAWGITADLREAEQVATIIPRVRASVGRLDLVANIAGGTQRGEWLGLEDTPNDVYSRVFALNVDYVFQVCRDAGKLMIEQGGGGAIVNVASISSVAAAPYHGPYGAAKRAVVALTQTMAIEWAKYRIRANTVTPGAVRTARAVATGAGSVMAERQKQWAPLERPVEKGEVAAAILFLLSDSASAITGQNLTVDCGVSARAVGGGVEYFERHRQASATPEDSR